MTPASSDWTVKPEEKLKYEQLFESLQPVEGIIPGNKVKGLLMDSKLPIETLSTIWELADQDKDGSLDKHEFIIAMHLVYQALAKRVIPSVLPKELLKPKTPEPSFNTGFVANFDMVEIPMAAPIPIPMSMPMQMASVPPPLSELFKFLIGFNILFYVNF